MSGPDAESRQPNHYELLGLARDATPKEIEDAHRRLVKEHHPDAGGTPEMFQRVTDAAKVLQDPDLRFQYDLNLPASGAIPGEYSGDEWNDAAGLRTGHTGSRSESASSVAEEPTAQGAASSAGGYVYVGEAEAAAEAMGDERAEVFAGPDLRNWLLFAGTLFSILTLYLLFRALFSGPSNEEAVIDPVTRPDTALIQVFPNRAEAGRDVEVSVRWVCPDDTIATLQVSAVGSGGGKEEDNVFEAPKLPAKDNGESTDVVLGSTLTPGDYRMQLFCDRANERFVSVADVITFVGDTGVRDATPRRETLGFEVVPNVMEPGSESLVRFSGERCDGDEVALQLFNTEVPVGDVIADMRTTVDTQGAWVISDVVVAPSRHTTYGVSAVCRGANSQFEYATRTIRASRSSILGSNGGLSPSRTEIVRPGNSPIERGRTTAINRGLNVEEIPLADAASPVEAVPRYTG